MAYGLRFAECFTMIDFACIDGGVFCVGVPALIIALFPCVGVWLKRRCKCKKEHKKP